MKKILTGVLIVLTCVSFACKSAEDNSGTENTAKGDTAEQSAKNTDTSAGEQAQEKTGDISKEEETNLIGFIKKQFGANMPPDTNITADGYYASPIQGFKSVNLTVNTQRGPSLVPLLVSDDGKYVIFGKVSKLSDLEDAEVSGLKQGTLNYMSQTFPVIVSADGKHIIPGGQVIDTTIDPHKEVMEKISLEDIPVKGADDAVVTIVEYSDFQCPFCKKGKEILPEILKEYDGKVKVVFKQLPLTIHKWAKGASIASLCAYQQGNDQFWAFHDVVFENQGTIKEETATEQFKAFAKDLGLDEQAFNTCLESEEVAARVDKEMQEAQTVGVRSTPTFIVNGLMVPGADVAKLKAAIDNKLSAADGS